MQATRNPSAPCCRFAAFLRRSSRRQLSTSPISEHSVARLAPVSASTQPAADYVVWRKNNCTTNQLPNDPIGGTIGPAQFNQWRANFGQPAGSGSGNSASVAIPEPTTLFLLMVGAIAMFTRARSCHKLVHP
jgi:hypothetical protein